MLYEKSTAKLLGGSLPSGPHIALRSHNLLAAHTLVPHVHAAVFNAVLEQRTPQVKIRIGNVSTTKQQRSLCWIQRQDRTLTSPADCLLK